MQPLVHFLHTLKPQDMSVRRVQNEIETWACVTAVAPAIRLQGCGWGTSRTPPPLAATTQQPLAAGTERIWVYIYFAVRASSLEGGEIDAALTIPLSVSVPADTASRAVPVFPAVPPLLHVFTPNPFVDEDRLIDLYGPEWSPAMRVLHIFVDVCLLINDPQSFHGCTQVVPAPPVPPPEQA